MLLVLLVPLDGGGAQAEDTGDPVRGGEIARRHCARCHVVDNRFGGIGSTPSFRILATVADSEARMRSFFARRPHPSFVRVPGVARWTDLPANATEITITPEQIEDLVAFTRTVAAKAKRN